MTTFQCNHCGNSWSAGPTRDLNLDEMCHLCLKDNLRLTGESVGDLQRQTRELEKKLSQVFPQVYDAVIDALDLTPTDIQKVENAVVIVQRRFGC